VATGADVSATDAAATGVAADATDTAADAAAADAAAKADAADQAAKWKTLYTQIGGPDALISGGKKNSPQPKPKKQP
jgi:hypothetical protein